MKTKNPIFVSIVVTVAVILLAALGYVYWYESTAMDRVNDAAEKAGKNVRMEFGKREPDTVWMDDVLIGDRRGWLTDLSDVCRKDDRIFFHAKAMGNIDRDYLSFEVEKDGVKLDEGTVKHPSAEKDDKIRCSIPDVEDGASVYIIAKDFREIVEKYGK